MASLCTVHQFTTPFAFLSNPAASCRGSCRFYPSFPPLPSFQSLKSHLSLPLRGACLAFPRTSEFFYPCQSTKELQFSECSSLRRYEINLVGLRRWSVHLKPDSGEHSTVSSPDSTSFPGWARNSDGIFARNAEALVDNAEPILDFIGEDAADFDLNSQKLLSWALFTVILGVVSTVLYFLWLDPTTGFGGTFIRALSSVSDNHEVVMLTILSTFAVVHSGLAILRDQGEKLIGERAYRVLFAGLSLPLAVSAVAYFINHRYDGIQLWQVQNIFAVRELVWVMSFVSFLFLYPSTFNLLEVAAVDKPKMHLYETGIMRITRHPQMVGQFIWCIAHTLWIGNSFMVTTTMGLLAHHLFGVWNGDRRLAARYGKAFEIVKQRTSIVPFAAVLDGRQKLPNDYYKEFLRVPYFTIIALTLGAYFSRPMLEAACHYLNW